MRNVGQAYFMTYGVRSSSGVNPAGDRGDTSPQMSDGEGTVMHHVPPNMAAISLHKRQKIRLYLPNYVIVLFLSNISCLQLCRMFYRGQFCELDFQILDHKQSRSPPPHPQKNAQQTAFLYADIVDKNRPR